MRDRAFDRPRVPYTGNNQTFAVDGDLMEKSELARGTRQILENLQCAGVTHLPRTSAVDDGSDTRGNASVRKGEAPAEPIGVSGRLGGSLDPPGWRGRAGLRCCPTVHGHSARQVSVGRD